MFLHRHLAFTDSTVPVLAGIALAASIGLVAFSPVRSEAGEICNPTITPIIKAQINRVIRDQTEKPVRLNCHDFRLSSRLVFVRSDTAYRLDGQLTHVKKLDFDDKWRFEIAIAENGRKWHLVSAHDYSLQGRPNPLQGNWEREAKRLITETGRLAAERVRKHYSACQGGDGDAGDKNVERRDHRTSCRLDVPTIR